MIAAGVVAKIRRGEGPFWGALKRSARSVLAFHLPVAGPTRALSRALYSLHVAFREAWIWAVRFFWDEPLFRGQCEAVGPGFRMERLPYIAGRGRIRIGRDVRLSGRPSFGFGGRFGVPELVVGDGTFIGHDCGLNASGSIRIGRHCLLASGVRVFDADGHPLDAARRREGEPVAPADVRPVVIGDDVWIGSGAVILKGVTIGDRSIVGAGAVVTRDVPADSVVAGNPARVVGRPHSTA
jgi:acetyltransferase-like isoleucine patch superfamily enzyme